MMEFLWEIGCEEIPAGMLPEGVGYFAQEMEKQVREVGLHVSGTTRIESQGTPRRLMVAVTGLAARQADRVEEMRGPPVDRAFDAAGNPTRAAEGFARGCGVTVAQLRRIETSKGVYLAYSIQKTGQEAAQLLPGIMTRILEGFPWPKTQRWGGGRTRFVRPIGWMVALLDGAVLPFGTVDGLMAGNHTEGHRFMGRGPFTVTGIEGYTRALAEGRVILEMSRRREIIEEGVHRLAAQAGGRARVAEELLLENANLTEWPIPVLGRFDPGYLDIPPEVLSTSMKNHQKYFPVEDADGGLLPCFIAVSNTEVSDPTLVVRGYERVLRARLEDAAFYWHEDRRQPLWQRREMLKKVVFQARLGSLYDKTVRIERLAERLVALADGRVDPEHVRLAAGLCKCDLVSGMVGQFPELQGIMGGYYARHDGLDAAVVAAIGEHYRPQGAADGLPGHLEGRLLSMADKLDTLVGCFAVGLVPTGAKDPFALRRAALGVIRILLDAKTPRFPLLPLLESAFDAYAPGLLEHSRRQTIDHLMTFIYGRLQNHLKTQGFDHDLIDAVQVLGLDDLQDAWQRVNALDRFRKLSSYAALVAANKRIANILQKAEDPWREHFLDAAALSEASERDLCQRIDATDRVVAAAVRDGNYHDALDHLARLRPEIDTFFEAVLVMDPDATKRLNRLALLARVRQAFQRVADVSRLAGPEG
ncbi:MAG: glycine--tRNA ligase subunit beta [Magnetococcales bacterium]|nr:glycine--tRNA ligase subunit beta [Magnetococcales bacterium]